MTTVVIVTRLLAKHRVLEVVVKIGRKTAESFLLKQIAVNEAETA